MTTPSDYWDQTPHHTTVWDIAVQPALSSSLPCKNKDACPITETDILREIRKICDGLALSERARAARYDKIVEVLKNEDR